MKEDQIRNGVSMKHGSDHSSFDVHWRRLHQLEKWRELAIRPSMSDVCHQNDLDLFPSKQCAGTSVSDDEDEGYLHDDCEALRERCLYVRKLLNRNLPPGQETEYEKDLVPRASEIPDAGLGLFYEPAAFVTADPAVNTSSKVQVAEPIEEGKTICYYSGQLHNFESARLLADKSYLMLVQGDVLVDPGPLPHIKARYINDPLDEEFVNCKFVPEKLRSAVVATRPIHPGEELFVSYGDAYWSQQKVVGRRKR